MFRDATAFTGTGLSGWTVSSVTNLKNTFNGATSFSENIAAWDVSSATSLEQMLKQATAFNHNLCLWGTKLPGTLTSLDVSQTFTSTACTDPSDPDLTASPKGPFCHVCDAASASPSSVPSEAPSQGPYVTASQTNYAIGEDIIVTFWYPSNLGLNAWIGLFAEGSDPSALPEPVYWNYICSDNWDATCATHPESGTVTLNSDSTSASWPITCGTWRAFLVENGSNMSFKPLEWIWDMLLKPFRVSSRQSMTRISS